MDDSSDSIPSSPLAPASLACVSIRLLGAEIPQANGEGLHCGGSYPSQLTYHIGGYVPTASHFNCLEKLFFGM